MYYFMYTAACLNRNKSYHTPVLHLTWWKHGVWIFIAMSLSWFFNSQKWHSGQQFIYMYKIEGPITELSLTNTNHTHFFASDQNTVNVEMWATAIKPYSCSWLHQEGHPRWEDQCDDHYILHRLAVCPGHPRCPDKEDTPDPPHLGLGDTYSSDKPNLRLRKTFSGKITSTFTTSQGTPWPLDPPPTTLLLEPAKTALCLPPNFWW